MGRLCTGAVARRLQLHGWLLRSNVFGCGMADIHWKAEAVDIVYLDIRLVRWNGCVVPRAPKQYAIQRGKFLAL